jgi:hypothetical protein
MEGLGLPAGTAGVIAAYDGLLHELIVDSADADDTERIGDRSRYAPSPPASARPRRPRLWPSRS